MVDVEVYIKGGGALHQMFGGWGGPAWDEKMDLTGSKVL